MHVHIHCTQCTMHVYTCTCIVHNNVHVCYMYAHAMSMCMYADPAGDVVSQPSIATLFISDSATMIMYRLNALNYYPHRTYIYNYTCIYTYTVGEITVGHRTFSEHFRHLSDQKPIRSANLSERTTSDERARTGNAQYAPAPVR